MWCPSVSLSVWSNAWLAGRAAPDDVLDALSAWAPQHSVTAYDAVAAGKTGLPWPDVDAAGAMSLLQTMRSVGGPRPGGQWPQRSAVSLILPVPGDVRGLTGGTQFARDALGAGEAVLVSGHDGEAIGVVPEVLWDESEDSPESFLLSWSVYSLPSAANLDHVDLGEAEYALRSVVRSAADVLGELDLSVQGDQDPRALVEEILEAGGLHRVPDHAPVRALRVLSTAAQVDAIVMVSSGMSPIGIRSASEARIADDALRPLSAVVRSARGAAVSAILQSAWDDHQH
jgi:hypothetical protein